MKLFISPSKSHNSSSSMTRRPASSTCRSSTALSSSSILLAILSTTTIIINATAAAASSDDDLSLYSSLSDGINDSSGNSLLLGRGCTTQFANPDNLPDGGILQVCTDPWMGGGLQLKNQATVNAWDYSHITFLAKAEYSTSCMPRFSMTCGWWPRYSSNAIELSGEYVAGGGSLASDEWRMVVIPTDDLLAGSDCEVQRASVESRGFYSINFLKCNPPPKYWVMDVALTNDPPLSFGSVSPTGSPTDLPTGAPTLYSPMVVWGGVVDDPNDSCLDARNNSTQVNSSSGDYLQLITDPWKGATLQIETHCFLSDARSSDPQYYNHFTDAGLYLTFLLKATGDWGPTCGPKVSMAGGSWIGGVGWSGQSPAIKIEHDVIDYGYVLSSEYRQVVIPMDRFKEGTTWDLARVHSISFHYCPDLYPGEQPKYYVKDIQVTKRPPMLESPAPTLGPTARVTEDSSLATHRMIHHHWYPVLGEGHNGDTTLWLEAVNNEWPSIPPSAGDHEVTVHIPMGSVVTYSDSSSFKLDKVIVHGTLIIKPASTDVVLTCSTLVVEMMGALTVLTEQDGHTVTIEIDGALDTSTDPEQTMLGVVNLGGTVTITGDPIPAKMAKLTTAIAAGGTNLVVDDPSGISWAVGDELVLPDTKEGQDVDHWNFKVQVPGETETVVIGALTNVGSELHITLQNPTQYGHIFGCHVAHVSRSITIKTSASSTDRGHVMHTGMGQFDVSNARFEGLGRTTTDPLDLTVLEDTGIELEMGLASLHATHIGTNQIARYALHSHHSMIKVHWSGNAIIESPRNCMVMHNSFGDITENVAVGCNGTAVFLESGTESGIVENNFLIGTGGGTRGHDDGRFASGGGQDMAHGGFGIWARGLLAPIRNNLAEGIFARSPYALFVHPLFVSSNIVPMVEGTNPALAGKTLHNIFYQQPVGLQTYGPFVGNSAFGTWRSALDLSYFGSSGVGAGHIIEGFNFTSLAFSGQGIFMVHSFAFDLVDGNYVASYPGNNIVAEFCNNGDPGVKVYYNNTVLSGFPVIRGGAC